jgi:uncharacterized protein involved in cysteine biosynthesis
VSLVASILTLTAIAGDRFFGIVYAVKARMTARRSKLIILLVWMVSFTVSIPLLLYRKQFSRHWADHVEVWCDDDWPYIVVDIPDSNKTILWYESRKIYYTTVSLILFFIPSVIMTVTYAVIIRTLWMTTRPGEYIGSMDYAQYRKKKKVYSLWLSLDCMKKRKTYL